MTDTCDNCKHHRLCFLMKSFQDAAREGIGMLNIDGDARPGKYLDIFATLASACTQYTEEEEQER